MPTQTKQSRKERAARRALSRSALYQLLSQALSYPSEEAFAALQGSDLPRAQQAAQHLGPGVAPLLAALDAQLRDADDAVLRDEHRRVFTHIMSADCPPCETFYTARHVFQETQEMSDIGGFFRAFGLEIADKARLDHISVELEFMQFLAYKEGYALLHHGPAKARLCREAQRKFMQDHLGRWALPFARRLADKAAAGYYRQVATLIERFVPAEIEFLRARPEPVSSEARWPGASEDEFSCPAAGECPVAP